MKNTKYIFLGAILATGFLVTSVWVRAPRVVQAADNNFTDGITVDSTGDGTDANTADSICDDGSGNCTLRAAIEESNQEAGAQTIKFNITGPEDFNNGGQSGYSIKPTSGLPNITDTVTINGYSQPGSQANTAVAPNPMNGTLLIEIDGSNAGTNIDVFYFDTGSDNSQIKGLVIGNFSDSSAIAMNASNVVVQGNYIGTNSIGTAARPNEVGVNNHNGTPGSGTGALIGGLNPADRNIISGNTDGSTATAGYTSTGWVIQGNYVGVGADGVTAIPNSTPSGSGAFSIDDCSDVLVGGDQPGASNVISGNTSYGLAPHNSPGLHIAGNYIGTDYTGTQAVPNLVGVIMSGDQQGSVTGGSTAAERNIISGNTISGVLSGGTGAPVIAGNYIGLNKSGMSAISNGTGVLIADDTVVGGSLANRNVISGNALFNVSIQGLQVPNSGAVVSGNYIGTNASGDIDQAITAQQGEGVRISANTSENIIGGDIGNVIAGNRGSGVSVRSLTIPQFNVTATPTKNAILGNQIYANEAGGPLTGSLGLGIDHYKATVNTFAFPADLQADSYVDLGVDANDPLDPDIGPNDYLNFPVINSTTASAGKLDVTFNLDVPSSPAGYRVEFFASSTADPSGYGEGQIYLGSTNVAGSVTNAIASLNIPSSFNSGNYAITATTTAKDDSTDGFGSTSEFSAVLGAQTVLAAVNTTNNTTTTAGGSLANTGQNSTLIALLAGGGIVSGASWLVVIRQRAKTRR